MESKKFNLKSGEVGVPNATACTLCGCSFTNSKITLQCGHKICHLCLAAYPKYLDLTQDCPECAQVKVVKIPCIACPNISTHTLLCGHSVCLPCYLEYARWIGDRPCSKCIRPNEAKSPAQALRPIAPDVVLQVHSELKVVDFPPDGFCYQSALKHAGMPALGAWLAAQYGYNGIPLEVLNLYLPVFPVPDGRPIDDIGYYFVESQSMIGGMSRIGLVHIFAVLPISAWPEDRVAGNIERLLNQLRLGSPRFSSYMKYYAGSGPQQDMVLDKEVVELLPAAPPTHPITTLEPIESLDPPIISARCGAMGRFNGEEFADTILNVAWGAIWRMIIFFFSLLVRTAAGIGILFAGIFLVCEPYCTAAIFSVSAYITSRGWYKLKTGFISFIHKAGPVLCNCIRATGKFVWNRIFKRVGKICFGDYTQFVVISLICVVTIAFLYWYTLPLPPPPTWYGTLYQQHGYILDSASQALETVISTETRQHVASSVATHGNTLLGFYHNAINWVMDTQPIIVDTATTFANNVADTANRLYIKATQPATCIDPEYLANGLEYCGASGKILYYTAGVSFRWLMVILTLQVVLLRIFGQALTHAVLFRFKLFQERVLKQCSSATVPVTIWYAQLINFITGNTLREPRIAIPPMPIATVSQTEHAPMSDNECTPSRVSPLSAMRISGSATGLHDVFQVYSVKADEVVKGLSKVTKGDIERAEKAGNWVKATFDKFTMNQKEYWTFSPALCDDRCVAVVLAAGSNGATLGRLDKICRTKSVEEYSAAVDELLLISDASCNYEYPKLWPRLKTGVIRKAELLESVEFRNNGRDALDSTGFFVKDTGKLVHAYAVFDYDPRANEYTLASGNDLDKFLDTIEFGETDTYRYMANVLTVGTAEEPKMSYSDARRQLDAIPFTFDMCVASIKERLLKIGYSFYDQPILGGKMVTDIARNFDGIYLDRTTQFLHYTHEKGRKKVSLFGNPIEVEKPKKQEIGPKPGQKTADPLPRACNALADYGRCRALAAGNCKWYHDPAILLAIVKNPNTCGDYLKDQCVWGDQCKWTHPAAKLPQRPREARDGECSEPVVQNTSSVTPVDVRERTMVESLECPDFIKKGRCGFLSRGESCKYRHTPKVVISDSYSGIVPNRYYVNIDTRQVEMKFDYLITHTEGQSYFEQRFPYFKKAQETATFYAHAFLRILANYYIVLGLQYIHRFLGPDAHYVDIGGKFVHAKFSSGVQHIVRPEDTDADAIYYREKSQGQPHIELDAHIPFATHSYYKGYVNRTQEHPDDYGILATDCIYYGDELGDKPVLDYIARALLKKCVPVWTSFHSYPVKDGDYWTVGHEARIMIRGNQVTAIAESNGIPYKHPNFVWCTERATSGIIHQTKIDGADVRLFFNCLHFVSLGTGMSFQAGTINLAVGGSYDIPQPLSTKTAVFGLENDELLGILRDYYHQRKAIERSIENCNVSTEGQALGFVGLAKGVTTRSHTAQAIVDISLGLQEVVMEEHARVSQLNMVKEVVQNKQARDEAATYFYKSPKFFGMLSLISFFLLSWIYCWATDSIWLLLTSFGMVLLGFWFHPYLDVTWFESKIYFYQLMNKIPWQSVQAPYDLYAIAAKTQKKVMNATSIGTIVGGYSNEVYQWIRGKIEPVHWNKQSTNLNITRDALLNLPTPNRNCSKLECFDTGGKSIPFRTMLKNVAELQTPAPSRYVQTGFEHAPLPTAYNGQPVVMAATDPNALAAVFNRQFASTAFPELEFDEEGKEIGPSGIFDDFLSYARKNVDKHLNYPLSGLSWKDYLAHQVEDKPRYERSARILFSTWKLKTAMRVMPKSDEVNVVKTAEQVRPRCLCVASDSAACCANIAYNALSCLKKNPHCAGGRNATALSAHIAKIYRSIPNCTFLNFDYKSFDSTQDHYIRAAIDARAFERHGVAAFLAAGWPMALYESVQKMFTAKFKNIYYRYKGKERQIMWRATMKGLTSSGDPWSTQCNSLRSILYGEFLCHTAGVPEDQCYVLAGGDDSMILVNDEYRARIEAAMDLLFHKCMPIKETFFGLGQVVQQVDWSYSTFMFLSRFGWVTPSGHVGVCRLANRVVRGNAMSNKVSKKFTAANYNHSINTELQSWVGHHPLLRRYLELRLTKLKAIDPCHATPTKVNRYTVNDGAAIDDLDGLWLSMSQPHWVTLPIFIAAMQPTLDCIYRTIKG
jgi:hypothetical protein